jgi:MFS family permease
MLTFPALVIPLTARYGMELSGVLALSFWMYLLFGLTALPWGLLTDRINAKILLVLFYSGAGICGLAAGFFINSPIIFSLCLTGIGLFSGIYHPAGLGLISRGISRMGMAMGYNGMAGNTGLAVAPLLAGVINYFIGTPAVYLILGCMNLSGSLLMILMPWSEPQNKEKMNSGSAKSLLAGFIVLCVCMMFGGIAYRGVTVILPSYFELRDQTLFDLLGRIQWLHVSRNVAATLLTSLVFVVGILGQYLGGRAAERFEQRLGYLFFHILALPMAVLMAYATGVSLVVVAMFYMLFLLGMQPIENTLVAFLTPDRLRHSAYGTKFILTFGVGSIAVYMVGWIKVAWSLPAVFIAMAGVSAGIVLGILTLLYVTRNVKLNQGS